MDAISILAAACSDPTAAVPIDTSETEETIANNDEIVQKQMRLYDMNVDDSLFQFKTSSRGNWTAEEDELLRNAVQQYGGRNWKKISDMIADRTDVQCLHRWQKVLRPGLIKGPWTVEVSMPIYS